MRISVLHSRLFRYGVALAALACVNALNWGLTPLVGPDHPFLLYFAAILLSGWIGGQGPAVCCTLIACVLVTYFSLYPLHNLFTHTVSQYARVSIFALEGFIVGAFCGRVRRSQQRLAQALAVQQPFVTTDLIEERIRLARLEGEIGTVLARGETLLPVLQGSAEALVNHANAAFARIWTFNKAGQMLELQVSAGLYTHLNGPHSRVPLGKFKIGLIAAERKPHLTNNVVGDPRVGDQEWARRERMVAFAGYPLLVGEELYGVLAMFSREKLSEATLSALELVSHAIALTIRRCSADEERTRLLRETQTAREAAEVANLAKDEFIAVVSHELRTPLNAILGWVRLLNAGNLGPEELAEAVEVIERNAVSQSRLIEDLLDVSRIISGKLRLNVRTVDLPEVVRDAVKTVQPAADLKGIRVETILDPNAAPVSGDADRLQQVVWNLVSNAVKFTPKKGRVQVRLARVNSHVELRVSDTGIGIDPQFLTHVFERFTQADSSSTRSHSGLGLGLGITRHLVELHGGSIAVFSDGENKGAMFVVNLPIMIVHGNGNHPERAHPTVAAAGVPFKPSQTLKGVRVVAVDDDADARKLLEVVLTHSEAEVTVVATVSEAVEAVRRLHPDVLLSDIEMPGEDGYSLITRVRALSPEEGGNTPAAALTAYARVEDRTRALRAGFQQHLPKPVEPAELVAVVANLAGREWRR
jgi:signal transduction histidine kinase/ActR/RegA family two-component response regulator